MRRFVLGVFAVLAFGSVAEAGLTQVTNFGSNPGGLNMYEYVPSGLPSGRPLVVVMHGCTQSASSMVSAGWNALADQYQFAVVYPEQTSTNNPVECFNWAGNYGNPADLERGMGENESIIEMVDYEISQHSVDTHQVYIMGFSAGAAFTMVMLATWPDRFVAGSSMEGIAYMCATTVNGAYSCQSPGVTKTAAAWGDLVRGADSGYSGPWPRVQLWEGSSDTTVVPANLTELIKQWTNVWGTDQTADVTGNVGSAATYSGYQVSGTTVVEAYTVASLTHAVSVGAEGSLACPSSAGAYFEDHKVCATLRAAKFFGVVPGGSGGSGSGSSGSGSSGGGSTPYVAIVAPTDGATVSGAVTIVVAAGDDAGIAAVDVAVDGTQIGEATMAPYQVPWNATATGKHTIVATARDTAGMTGMAMADVTVATGSGGGGSNGDGPGSANDLPACSLDAGGRGARGWALIVGAFVIAVRIGRRRRPCLARQ
jgi:poly(hydroxyalkanoate) depolymerase family esterase